MVSTKRDKCVKISKVIVFLVLLIAIYGSLQQFLQPAWYENSTYDTVEGFYEETPDTIEAIFLGASTILNGIIPMELYENYGICSYNLATESQPMLASYYWLEEAYRFHSDSLKVVMLDASTLRRTPDMAYYRKAIDHMKLSRIKYNAVKDYTKIFNESIYCLDPVYSYHSRWTEFDTDDFERLNYKTNDYLRGYNFSKQQYIDNFLKEHDSYKLIEVPEYYINEMEEESILNEESLYYAEKIVNFCEEHNLELVLMKTPVIESWSSANHNATKNFAEKYNLDFLDFNYDPLLSEMGYNHAVDSSDGGHMNYYGASKLTSCLGKYLTTNSQLSDVRGKQSYNFLEAQLENYKKHISDVINLAEQKDVLNYLTIAKNNKDYTIFIVAKDDATGTLSNRQREGFAQLGLQGLSLLEFRNSYLAVIDKGEIVYDMSERLSLLYEDRMNDKLFVSLKSGGIFAGDIASCKINGVEYSKNHRGLNVIVYDNEQDKVVDTTYFDTWESELRVGLNKEIELTEVLESGESYEKLSYDLKTLYLYNLKCENAKASAILKETIGKHEVTQFIENYKNSKHYVVFISGMTDVSEALNDKTQNELSEIGLVEITKIAKGDSYLAIIDEGQVVFEKRDHGEMPISKYGIGYSIISGGFESGNISSIKINGTEYSNMQSGINIVVFDKRYQMVIDTVTFDTLFKSDVM